MDNKLITDLFNDSWDNGFVKNKLGKEERLLQLINFIDSSEKQEFHYGIFSGDSKSYTSFVLGCYKDKLLSVEKFGPILYSFILNHAGGILYTEWQSLIYEMMDYCGLENLLSPEVYKIYDQLPSVVTIYRGGNFNDTYFFFWSLEKKISEQYVRYAGLSPHLITGTIPKEKIRLMSTMGASLIVKWEDVINPKIIAFRNNQDVLIEIPEKYAPGTL